MQQDPDQATSSLFSSASFCPIVPSKNVPHTRANLPIISSSDPLHEGAGRTAHIVPSSLDSDICDPFGILSGNMQHAGVQSSITGSKQPSLGRPSGTASSLPVSFDGYDPLGILAESMQDAGTQFMFSCTQASQGKTGRTANSFSSSSVGNVHSPLGVLSENMQYARVQSSVLNSHHVSPSRTASNLPSSVNGGACCPLSVLSEGMPNGRPQSPLFGSGLPLPEVVHRHLGHINTFTLH